MTQDSQVVLLPYESDHPCFAGHFPGLPIIPGVQLLDRAMRLIETRHDLKATGLQMAKFLHPAGPGDLLELEYRIADASVSFEIRAGEQRIASGKFDTIGPAAA